MLAREARRPLSLCIALLLLALVLRSYLAALLLAILSALTAFFFRDPERRVNWSEGKILSPADGRVERIERSGSMARIVIRLSPFDVHVQRSPISGRVLSVREIRGSRYPIFLSSSLGNARNEIDLEGLDGSRITVVQVAGFVARRIRCYVKPGDFIRAGDRLGIIYLGSRVEIILPADRFEILVNPGQRVKAGESLIAIRELEASKRDILGECLAGLLRDS